MAAVVAQVTDESTETMAEPSHVDRSASSRSVGSGLLAVTFGFVSLCALIATLDPALIVLTSPQSIATNKAPAAAFLQRQLEESEEVAHEGEEQQAPPPPDDDSGGAVMARSGGGDGDGFFRGGGLEHVFAPVQAALGGGAVALTGLLSNIVSKKSGGEIPIGGDGALSAKLDIMKGAFVAGQIGSGAVMSRCISDRVETTKAMSQGKIGDWIRSAAAGAMVGMGGSLGGGDMRGITSTSGLAGLVAAVGSGVLANKVSDVSSWVAASEEKPLTATPSARGVSELAGGAGAAAGVPVAVYQIGQRALSAVGEDSWLHKGAGVLTNVLSGAGYSYGLAESGLSDQKQIASLFNVGAEGWNPQLLFCILGLIPVILICFLKWYCCPGAQCPLCGKKCACGLGKDEEGEEGEEALIPGEAEGPSVQARSGGEGEGAGEERSFKSFAKGILQKVMDDNTMATIEKVVGGGLFGAGIGMGGLSEGSALTLLGSHPKSAGLIAFVSSLGIGTGAGAVMKNLFTMIKAKKSGVAPEEIPLKEIPPADEETGDEGGE